eukprot:evm.model.scf_53EXC.6 EVM.evm.TU.scf_53EXC.6   scf_53EXC:51456-53243(-)
MAATLEEVDSVIDGAEEEICRVECAISGREAPWDGYGGLVRICDDHVFRERGFVRAFVPRRFDEGSVISSAISRRGGSNASSSISLHTLTDVSTSDISEYPSTPHKDNKSRKPSHDRDPGGRPSPTFRDHDLQHCLQNARRPSTGRNGTSPMSRASSQSLSASASADAAGVDGNLRGARSAEVHTDLVRRQSGDARGSERGSEPSATSLSGNVADVLEAEVAALRAGDLSSRESWLRSALVADQAFRAAGACIKGVNRTGTVCSSLATSPCDHLLGCKGAVLPFGGHCVLQGSTYA